MESIYVLMEDVQHFDYERRTCICASADLILLRKLAEKLQSLSGSKDERFDTTTTYWVDAVCLISEPNELDIFINEETDY